MNYGYGPALVGPHMRDAGPLARTSCTLGGRVGPAGRGLQVCSWTAVHTQWTNRLSSSPAVVLAVIAVPRVGYVLVQQRN